MHRRGLQALAFSLLSAVSLSLRGDDQLGRVVIPSETSGSARRLAAADKLAADRQWSDAIDEYQRILDEIGDELAPVTARSSVQARTLCHLRLAALPVDALKIYRDKVDTQAQKWLKQWEETRDARWLRRIVDDAFCSTPAEQALDLLGDVAFERGDFDEADQWWRLLVRALNSNAVETPRDKIRDQPLLFPNPKSDPARIRAKHIAALIFRSERDEARAELDRFREEHGKAEGKLLGRQGVYADILKDISERPAPVAAEDDAWPTFAGGFSRQHILARPPMRGLLEEPTWIWQLSQSDEAADKPTKTPSMRELARSLVYHPVIVGDQVLVADARFVTAFDLRTGKRAVWYDLVRDGVKGGLELLLKMPPEAGLGYTLSVADNLVFVRMGGQAVRPPATEKPVGKVKPATRKSFLVCLNQAGSIRQRWLKAAQQDDSSTAMFEGTPVVHQGRVFIAVTRFGAATTTAIASFDADTGRERWRKPVDICEVQDHRMLEPRYRHYLLTLAGSKVISCSHSGAIVALDMDTGRIAWAARYPGRSDKLNDGKPTPRSVAPCLYAGGKLFIAPSDYDRVLCLEPETGRLLWESTPAAEVVHLLGATQGKLIVTTANDIRALDVTTGQTLRDWLQPEDGTSLPPFGRGLLAGSWVCWPTVHGLRVLDLATGQPISRVPYNFSANTLRGNLAATAGCLVAADATTLRAYVAPRKFLEERRNESRKHPDSAAARYALALAERDAELPEQALQSLADVERMAAPSQASLARWRRHEILLDMANAAADTTTFEKAADFLNKAAGSEFPAAARLQALGQAAKLWTDARQPERAVMIWQSILRDESLRAGCISRSSRGILALQRADLAAQQRIHDLIQAHGPKIYESQEREAQRLLGEKTHRSATLARVAREFPNASVTPASLLELAKAEEMDEHPGSAAASYRQIIDAITPPAKELKAEALAGLARCLERQACWQASRAAWQRLDREFGDQVVAAIDREHKLSTVAEKQLQKPAYRSLDSPPAAMKLPLRRGWQIASRESGPWRMIAFEGPEKLCLLCQSHSAKSVISCRDIDSGKERWQGDLPHSISWTAQDADLVVLAGDDGVTCLRAADGMIQWRWAGQGMNDRHSTLSHFQRQHGTVYFLEDRRRIVALDIASGLVLWTQWSPAARLGLPSPRGQFFSLHANNSSSALHANAVIAQTSAGRLMILDDSGRRLYDLSTTTEPWPHSPVFLDDHRVLIIEGHQEVALFNLAAGKEVWRRRTAQPTVSGEAPTVVSVVDDPADGTRKLILLLIDGWHMEAIASDSGESHWHVGNHHWLENKASTATGVRGIGASDADAAYFARGNVLCAHSVRDGRELWQTPLSDLDASWQVVLTGVSLVVYPHGMTTKARPSMFLGGMMFLRPMTSRPEHFPVLILDRKDGALLQRLNFAFDPKATIQMLEKGLIVHGGGETWRIQSE